MANYMIHACPKRMWYVKDFLVPSLLKKGIAKTQIIVYNDNDHLGNLKACMDAFSQCSGDGGTWHLQDDVCICDDFKDRTEQYDNGLVCGFSSKQYDGEGKQGEVRVRDMWFSFPCIRIPNNYARHCSEWVTKHLIGNPVYSIFWKDGVNDDWCFRAYLKTFHLGDKAINLAPNLVDHIDYLIGGGTGKNRREQPVRAQYWQDDDIIKELEESLKYAGT